MLRSEKGSAIAALPFFDSLNCLRDLEGCDAGFRNRVVMCSGGAADSDGADDFAVILPGDAAGEDHNLAVVGGVDAEELVARLRVVAEVLGGDVEGAGGPGFF